ncbi:Maf family protein [Candidatus Babeliales bacterium]|nr:Maf family protein [Candidatus Babeliales bacterium]
MSDVLYLASQSKNRQELLRRCKINYEVLRHDADELSIDPSLEFNEYVLAIANEKMKHAVLPQAEAVKQRPAFILTADTMLKTIEKNPHLIGKPIDREDARRLLGLLRKVPFLVTTACVLEKKKFDKKWISLEKKELIVSATAEFCVEEKEIDFYLDSTPESLSSCGATAVEGFGDNFLKSINGSYSAALGIPIYELRKLLKELDFSF